MEQNKLKIKCPYCGTILTVGKIPNIENCTVTCPACGQKDIFRNFQLFVPHVSETTEETEIPEQGQREERQKEETQIPTGLGLGWLVNMATGEARQLHVGRNTIGRQPKAEPAQADFAYIDEQRKVSRRHAIITVTPMPGGGFRHCVQNWENMNSTYVDAMLVGKEDVVVLNHGQVLTLANSVRLRFEVRENNS